MKEATIPGTDITQTTMSVQEALDHELLDGGLKRWAQLNPDGDVHVYHFGGVYGGLCVGREARFDDLISMATFAGQVTDRIWDLVQDMAFAHTLRAMAAAEPKVGKVFVCLGHALDTEFEVEIVEVLPSQTLTMRVLSTGHLMTMLCKHFADVFYPKGTQ